MDKRIILHNIFICHDMMKHYQKRTPPPRCTMMVDLRKAYDFVSWEFLEDPLVKMEF